jgi:hypothetical protein
MHTTMVLENHMSLKIFDTQLGVQGMEDICELWKCLVPFLATVWSILYTGRHNFQHGSIVP